MKQEQLAIIETLSKDSAFGLIEKHIKQRPGVDWRNYGGGRDGYNAYKSELNRISKQRREALAHLEQARDRDWNPEALAEAMSAYSGRLSFVLREGTPALEYVTGQYFPTEYRLAARAVLADYLQFTQPPSPQRADLRTFDGQPISEYNGATHPGDIPLDEIDAAVWIVGKDGYSDNVLGDRAVIVPAGSRAEARVILEWVKLQGEVIKPRIMDRKQMNQYLRRKTGYVCFLGWRSRAVEGGRYATK